MSFDRFNLNITGNDDYFPIFTMAKFQQGRWPRTITCFCTGSSCSL
nr:Chloramphenicol O-acetyltransferase [Escherichia coli O25b:H4-ST131]